MNKYAISSLNIDFFIYFPFFLKKKIEGIFIVGAKRTAFGTFGGAFKNVTATQLQTHACKATLEAAGVRPDQVDSVVIGNVLMVCLIEGRLKKKFYLGFDFDFSFFFFASSAITIRWNFFTQTCSFALWYSN